jgi:hypothetical protein
MASTKAPDLMAAPGPAHNSPAQPAHQPPADRAAQQVPRPRHDHAPQRDHMAQAPTVPAQPGPAKIGSATGAASRSEAPAVPAHMLPHRTPAQLLAIAHEGLTEAAKTGPDGLRYATAHLAALRAAAALIAARARPSAPSRRARATSAWSLLVLVAPEFSDWAGYFALGASKRAAAEAGIPHVVSAREADDLLRAAEQFVTVAESSLGFTYQPPLAA